MYAAQELVTGSSSGFGLLLSRIAGRRIFRHRDVTQLVSHSRTGCRNRGQWSQLSMNSTNSAQVIKVLEKSGHEIDVLADNAGYCIYAHLDTFAKGKIRVEMESMSFGPLCLIRGVLPHMRRRWFDIIVKMSSGAALEARDNAGAKCTWAILSSIMNTNGVNAAVLGRNPMPGDYSRSVKEHRMRSLSSRKHFPKGDKDKAMMALYEVVFGKGGGAGREVKRFLSLGTDMAASVSPMQEYPSHCLEVLGDIIKDVSIAR